MPPKPASPTPIQSELIRQTTVFAYGYSSMMALKTEKEHFKTQAENLLEDLRLFGCLRADGINLQWHYLQPYHEGRAKALKELERMKV